MGKPASNRAARIHIALPLILISLSLFVLLVVRPTTMQGMNMDGVVYVDLALNMANGTGTLWDPSLMPHFFQHFREHPPLGIYLESLAFRWFGDSVYVEKWYCFALVCTLFATICRLWQITHPADGNPYLSACFLFLLWTVCPMSGWVGLGNYLEVPLAVFTTLASLAIVTAVHRQDRPYLLGVGGVLVCAAFFINGPVAFFPLSIPAIHWLVFRKATLRTCVVQSLVLLAVLFASLAAVLTYAPARANTLEYINSQVLASISGARDASNTGAMRLMGLLYIATQFYIAIPLAISLLVMQARSTRTSLFQTLRGTFRQEWTRFFLLLALAASLPILISSRQTAHYFYPSLPFYLLAFATVLLPYFHSGYAKLHTRSATYKTLLVAGLALVLISTAFTLKSTGEVLDDHDKHIHDLAAIHAAVPAGELISLDENADSAFIFNFYRYYRRITLTEAGAAYHLQDRAKAAAPAGYTEVPTDLKYYRLFRKL